jgi:hypothetical protein
MTSTCHEKTPLDLNHHLNSSDNGLIMSSGLIELESLPTISRIYNSSVLWANQEEEGLKSLTESNLTSTKSATPFQVNQT